MNLGRIALCAGALMIAPQLASAQQTGGAAAQGAAPADTELPAVDVVQETPVQKAARAKKKAVAVSPLSTAPAAPTPDAPTQAPPVTVPSAVTNVTDTEIEREGTGSVQQTLQQQVPGIIISDAAGNPMRAEVSFRGFDASPVSGRSQGVAVYQNGVRINEAFGDTVQWDVLPSNAIASMSVVSNNPSFGLNALGGAISIQMKDGFSYQGAEVDIMGGSFGRRQIGVQAGGSSGNASVYVAAEGIKEDGFRDFSESEIKRFYGDIGLKGSLAEVHFSLTAAKNEFGASAAAPVELLEQSWSNTFTTPQTTNLEVFMPTLSATVKATDTLTVSSAAYYRSYKNRVLDGNVTELEECGVNLCPEDSTNVIRNAATGVALLAADFEEPLGTLDRLHTDSQSWGAALEGQEKAKLFGRPNLFIAGVSYDHGSSKYKTSSEIGTIGNKYVVEGSGIIITDDDGNPATDDDIEVGPRNLSSTNTYWGLYFSNALEVTDRLTVTVGGRYNNATIKLEDNTGLFPGLNATNGYERFNPMAGADYKLTKGVSVYGGYSESNRAPTPAELGCAEPEAPCLVEGFLTDDPPLDQVVGRTAEVGLRGQGFYNGGQYTWGAGLFRTLASDDILPITDTQGRVYFINAGDTLRQGVELSGSYQTSKWNVYATYAFVDATLDTCDDPSGECAFLEAGDRLPGIPRHRFKAGFEYWLTGKWKFGADLVAASNQQLYPNEATEEAEDDGISSILKGYTRVDLHTSYDITDNIQVYGLVKNLFNQKYGLYGTYFEADEVPFLGTGGNFDDPRTISPSQPFAAYGGVKFKF
ncbi:TonB-dependent receptor domain-containing protein [Hyphomicrobium sp. LHD-15]|uniref:TonB-dependent receptor n=1 Tax=Hyphomicrobium sp. LHD-15 TaxID=3072142 RepID=UPI00280FDED8|nr:TonB-dependent receptor [Hyphomicrobium sp. LHD-15]MDQ8699036.1 TonB-dependent receptor [Hyphomicrobium sp. LHD-15]